jgi:transcriptional regulator with XRE-family HTH domain
MNGSQIDELVKDREGMRFFQQERLILSTTERICEIMERDGVSRKCLADAMGTSKSFVSQLLDGSRNMTLRTLSDVFLSLGYAVHVHTGSIGATITAPVQLSVDVDDPVWPEAQSGWDTSDLTFNIRGGENDGAAA